MKRKIIQICSSSLRDDFVSPDILYALCNDGTVWFMETNDKGWIKVQDIPQDDIVEGEEMRFEIIDRLPQVNGEMYSKILVKDYKTDKLAILDGYHLAEHFHYDLEKFCTDNYYKGFFYDDESEAWSDWNWELEKRGFQK